MKRNENQIFKNHLPGRNDQCPCGSGKKWKKCCKTPTCYHNKQLLKWLKENDKTPPVDYDTITSVELDDPATTIVFRKRKEELLAGGPSVFEEDEEIEEMVEEFGDEAVELIGPSDTSTDDLGCEPPLRGRVIPDEEMVPQDDGHVDPIADLNEGVQDGQDLPE